MEPINTTKKLLYILAAFLILSLAGNAYLMYQSSKVCNCGVGKCTGISKSAVSGAVGADPDTDCELCEAIVNLTYKYMPENANYQVVDSVVTMVFKNVPTEWRYLVEDIQEHHDYEYKSYIEKKYQGRYIGNHLNYCREY